MSFNPIARAVALATVGTSLMIPALAQADFVKDSKASLELRNFYFNSDLRDNADGPATRNKAEEWAQGFIVKAESGFTDGTVGVGVDAITTLGVKLDSGRGTSGTGLLQLDRGERTPATANTLLTSKADGTGDAQTAYGDLGATAKFRVSKSTLKLGTVMPNLPTISGVDNRLLPTMYQGGWLNSTDIAGLTLDMGEVNRINLRDSSDQQLLVMSNPAAAKYRPAGAVFVNESEKFDFFNASYKWNPSLTTTYSGAVLQDLYKQHMFNVVHTLPIAEGQSLKSDIRYAMSREDSNSGVNNNAFGAMFTYSLKAHKLGVAYQSMVGDSGFAFISNNNPFLVNYIQVNDFSRADEKSWQVRYDYDFASLGVPGLTFMTRYVSGEDFALTAAQNGGTADTNAGKEWERNSELKYVVQAGSLKGVGVHLRNATVRGNFTSSDIDQNRLILSYTLPLL